MSWSKEVVSILIDLYEQQPVLYNMKNKNYHNKLARSVALDDIANKISIFRPNTTSECIKTKINTMRTQFNKALAEIKNNLNETGRKSPKSSLWFFEKFLFLTNHITSKCTFSNAQETNIKEEIDNIPNGMVPEVVLIEPSIEDTQHKPIISTPVKRKRISSDNSDDVLFEDQILDKSKKLCTSLKENDDEWATFLSFASREIISIKCKLRQRKLKREIIQLIFKYQEEDENDH